MADLGIPWHARRQLVPSDIPPSYNTKSRVCAEKIDITNRVWAEGFGSAQLPLKPPVPGGAHASAGSALAPGPMRGARSASGTWFLALRHARWLSTGPGDGRRIPLGFPTLVVWGANTGVGKTLVSAGLAAAVARAEVGAIWMVSGQ